jgi:acetolactate synthase-1/3 small subunit
MRTTFNVVGENTLFTLNRLVSLLRGRRFDVVSLTPARTADHATTSITVVVDGARVRPERVVSCVEKLDEVFDVAVVEPDMAVRRELALVKVHHTRAADTMVDALGADLARVVDRTAGTMIVELVGEPEAVDRAVDALAGGILAMARIGAVALERGVRTALSPAPAGDAG